MKITSHSLAAVALATAGLAIGSTAHAQDAGNGWAPSRFLVEYGHNDRGPATNVGRLGVIWPFDVSWNPWGNANLTAYGEATVGRFETRSSPERGKRGVTQLGLTPVLRLFPWGGWSGTFFEAGIGANVFLPKYKAGVHEFSTEYQFGDHLGVGWRFDTPAKDEVALRFEHFSNASIKEPNPGENFIQLRYSRGF